MSRFRPLGTRSEVERCDHVRRRSRRSQSVRGEVARRGMALRAMLVMVAKLLKQAEPVIAKLEHLLDDASVDAKSRRIIERQFEKFHHIARAQYRYAEHLPVNAAKFIWSDFEWRCHRMNRFGLLPVGMAIVRRSLEASFPDTSRPSELTEMLERLSGMMNLLEFTSSNFIYYLDLPEARKGPVDSSQTGLGATNLLDATLVAIQQHRSLAHQRGIEIATEEVEIAALPAVSGACWPELVASNLLCNAILYGAPSSRILVRAVRSADDALCGLTVEGHGFGIPRSEIDHIWRRGYRGRWAARIAPGAGLGLFIVQEVVEAHGGRVEITSTPWDGPGLLTRATALFPTTDAP